MKNRRPKPILAALGALALAAAGWLLPAPPAQAEATAGAAPASAAKASKPAKTAAPPAVASKPATGQPAAQPPLVDINSAPARTLQRLPGISPETAQRIVVHRPYGSKSQLVTRGALDEPTYQSIRHLVIARQP